MMKQYKVYGNRHYHEARPFEVSTIKARSLEEAQDLAEVMYEEALFAVYKVVEVKE